MRIQRQFHIMSDEERAAVDGDVQALDRLLERLKEVSTPGECQKLRQPLILASSIFPAQRFAAKFAEEEKEPGQDK